MNQSLFRLGGSAGLLLLMVRGVAVAQTAGASADVTKEVRIEAPTKQVVAARTSALSSVTEFKNPKVPPGVVRWHASFAEACAAARQSGKPVLLFQMMGRLDEQFC